MNNLEQIINTVSNWDKDSRLSWGEYFIATAFLISSRSPDKRLKVGCVLVRNNHVISMGYNGFLPKVEHQSFMENRHEQATVHAEQNSIADCAKRGVSCKDSTAFVTHYPCIICTRLLLASGISEIKYIDDIVYMNDGDWVESCTALVEHHDGRWEIITWTKEKDNDETV